MILTTDREREAFEAGRQQGNAEMTDVAIAAWQVAPDLLPRLGPRPTLARLAEILPHYDPAQLAILKPYNPAEAIGVKEACQLARGRSESTMREWVARFGIGRNIIGTTEISLPALMMLLDDDASALGYLLMGLRSHPAVQPYMARAGLPIAA